MEELQRTRKRGRLTKSINEGLFWGLCDTCSEYVLQLMVSGHTNWRLRRVQQCCMRRKLTIGDFFDMVKMGGKPNTIRYIAVSLDVYEWEQQQLTQFNDFSRRLRANAHSIGGYPRSQWHSVHLSKLLKEVPPAETPERQPIHPQNCNFSFPSVEEVSGTESDSNTDNSDSDYESNSWTNGSSLSKGHFRLLMGSNESLYHYISVASFQIKADAR
eukprot:TRINITY_DN774_c0_g1_i3.p1 TRINITY_DN774_c0_g1~~TRINITY_DN774_c0_g1_i3.p1  ORF type:complete len:215 (+),score=35.93 TRINITY_DN774_c0_g1_i3:84-728(+)